MTGQSRRERGRGGIAVALLRVLLVAALCIGTAPPLALAAAEGGAGSGAPVSVQSGKSDASTKSDESEKSTKSEKSEKSDSGDDSKSKGSESSKADDEGGSSSSSSSADKGKSESSSSSAADDEPDEPAAPTLAGLYLFYENYDKPTKPLAYNPTSDPLIVKDKGTMELYAQSEFTNGNIGWVADSGVGVVWSIEKTLDEDGAEQDGQIAEVDRAEGVVRALGQGNGKVVVRCQAQNYDVHADITITIKGNAGVPYLTDLQICDENGSPYENDAEIRIESDGFGLEKKFTLRATYHDPATDADVVRETAKGDVVEGATWTVSGDSNVSYVNPDTGVFIAQATGSVRLTCSVAGAGLLGDTLSDYVFVLCGGDTLDPDRDYSPADELKVVVKYATEDKQGIGGEDDYEKFRTWYYSPSELEALGVTENLYTLVKHSGSWGTMKARGVYLEKLVSDVINSDDFSIDMVKGFYFGATDDYNPGFVGEAWLFETQRYYYPNMSIGSGNLGAVPVAPMIATKTVQEDLIDEPAGELSDQTRFRLCLGAESTTVNNAQQSIYNIYKITVILNGAPPVGSDEPGGGHKGDGGDNKGDDNKGDSDDNNGDDNNAGGDDDDDGNSDGGDEGGDPGDDGDDNGNDNNAGGDDGDDGNSDGGDEGGDPGDDDNKGNDDSKGDDSGDSDDDGKGAESGDDSDGKPKTGPGVTAPENGAGDDQGGPQQAGPNDGKEGQPDDSSGEKRDGSQDAEDGRQGASRDQPERQESAQGGENSAVEESPAEQRVQAERADSVQAAEQEADLRAEATEQTERAIEDMFGDSQHRFQVYEMMTAQPALVEALQLDNPLAPFVAPGLALVALSGGVYSWLWFRRQTAPPGAPSILRGAAAALVSAIAR